MCIMRLVCVFFGMYCVEWVCMSVWEEYVGGTGNSGEYVVWCVYVGGMDGECVLCGMCVLCCVCMYRFLRVVFSFFMVVIDIG